MRAADSPTPKDWPHIADVLKLGRIPPSLATKMRAKMDEVAAAHKETLHWGPERMTKDKALRIWILEGIFE